MDEYLGPEQEWKKFASRTWDSWQFSVGRGQNSCPYGFSKSFVVFFVNQTQALLLNAWRPAPERPIFNTSFRSKFIPNTVSLAIRVEIVLKGIVKLYFTPLNMLHSPPGGGMNSPKVETLRVDVLLYGNYVGP